MLIRRFLTGCLIAMATPALAQGPRPAINDPNTPSIDTRGTSSSPTSVDRDRSDRVTPALAAPPAVAAPRPTIGVAAASSRDAFRQVRVEGSSLPRDAIDDATRRFIGQPMTPDMLKELANAVGGAYAQSDIAYYSVMIPAQTLDNGVVTIRAVEGYVKQYTLAGVTVSTPTHLLEAHVHRIMQNTPLRKSVLERSLSLMRDIPGQTVDAQIRQIDASGALVLDLKVRRKQLVISLNIDNDAISNVISSFQAQLAVTVNGLVREGDSTRVSGYLPLHPDRYQFYSISHSTPIGNNGMTVTASASTIRTTSIDRQIDGRATLASISLNYPLIRTYKTNLSLSASLDGVNSSNYYLDTRFGDYHARTVRAGLSWSKSDDKQGYALALVGSRGLNALGARAFQGYSETKFSKVNLQAVGVKAITPHMTVKLTGYGQYSDDRLPVTERMALGGRGTGRAFNAGTVTGDRGVAGQLELEWKLPKIPAALKGSSLFTYVDGGTLHSVARPVYALPAENVSLASVGVGARVAFLEKWRASIEAAFPVKRPNQFYRRSPRLFFGLGRSF